MKKVASSFSKLNRSSSQRKSLGNSNINIENIDKNLSSSKPILSSLSSKNVDKDNSNNATWALEEILLQPYNHLLKHPGKEIRSKLIAAFDFWLKVPKEQLVVITKIVEMLHTASLLIDDVEDSSTLRRGVPAAHQIYGIPATINCANYVYFLALNELVKLENAKLIKIYTEELMNLHRGQGMELYWRDHVVCPSEEEFIEMVSNKTGGLLRLAVKLMTEASNINDKDYVNLVNDIGIHFQVRDDYMNLQSAVVNILKQHTSSLELKEYAVKLMEGTGSFRYTEQYLAKTEKKVRDEIERLGGNPVLERIMDLLSVPLSESDGGVKKREAQSSTVTTTAASTK
ncbi:14142_t:CDS:2 [Ambispora leptoticha]|uniref:14142_t:CDS:1 n=1 Tax=Ambispora leptoticha TaxID=144679 RepID=A0A9N9FY56_9GLOM|nr:14142_t:CDS:2 [Ambispora leptoticha]